MPPEAKQDTAKEYRRTQVSRIHIRGYRSISDLSIENIPSLVVMHGPNGSGKSNILRAMRLVLRAVGIDQPIPSSPDSATLYEEYEASTTLDLQPFDFHKGSAGSEIRIGLSIELGTRAQLELGGSTTHEVITLEAVFQHVGTAGAGKIKVWFDKAESNSGLSLFSSETARPVRDAIRNSAQQLDTNREQISQHQSLMQTQPQSAAAFRGAIRGLERQRDAIEGQIATQRAQLGAEELRADSIRYFLGRSCLQVSEAYRRVEDQVHDLFQSMVSASRVRVEAIRRLSKRLASAGLFGSRESVELRPVQDGDNRQIFVNRPGVGELPLANLGTGEQQLVLLLGQRVITPHPIAQLEEPEAHLYRDHMLKLAEVLADSVSGAKGLPDVDQLWIATHHHAFAIADEYYDISLDEAHATVVKKRPRSEAIGHFWEPGPIWDALRRVVKDGLATNSVIFRDDNGKDVRSKELQEAIDNNGELARRFVDVTTEAIVLSLRKQK